MSSLGAPTSTTEALAMLESAWAFLADLDPTSLPAPVLSDCLLGMERADAVAAAARGPMLAAFDAQDGPVAYGQRNVRAWLVHTARVTKGQAYGHQAVQRLAEAHRPQLAVHPDGTSQVTSPHGTAIHSHTPPPHPDHGARADPPPRPG